MLREFGGLGVHERLLGSVVLGAESPAHSRRRYGSVRIQSSAPDP
ncbi:hypothetical protein FM103_11545 [Corynebacterium xerosis]|nr:hypothetical protein FM103_11545 [Corynebacterium xerosis]